MKISKKQRPFPIITLTTPDEPVIEIDATDDWDENKTKIQRPGPTYKLSTDYEKKIRAANKIKNKYFKKKVGQRKHVNKISAEWLKTAGYLDTADQDKINFIFVSPKKKTLNKIPGDSGHFIRTEIDDTDFKNENLVTKKWKNKKDRTPYSNKNNNNNDETLKILEDIAVLEPGKKPQIAAKKIREKYKKIRQNKKVAAAVLPTKVQINEAEKITKTEPPATVHSKVSTIKTANRIKDKYVKIRKKNNQKITDQLKKDKLLNAISAIENAKNSSDKKR